MRIPQRLKWIGKALAVRLAGGFLQIILVDRILALRLWGLEAIVISYRCGELDIAARLLVRDEGFDVDAIRTGQLMRRGRWSDAGRGGSCWRRMHGLCKGLWQAQPFSDPPEGALLFVRLEVLDRLDDRADCVEVIP
jgi:hypothetical protein